jgi:N-acetylmuramoyl-L-alanine amidase
MKTVYIDPGHGLGNVEPGRFDSGAVGHGQTEAAIVRKWAETLAYIGRVQFGAEPTHPTQKPESGLIYILPSEQADRPVARRAREAVRLGTTHFISLHCNAPGRFATGTETIIPAEPDATDDREFAQLVQASALAAVGRRNRGIKTEAETPRKSLAVMGRHREMSVCLLEIGFISNARDVQRMLDRDVRIKFAMEFWRRLRDS